MQQSEEERDDTTRLNQKNASLLIVLHLRSSTIFPPFPSFPSPPHRKKQQQKQQNNTHTDRQQMPTTPTPSPIHKKTPHEKRFTQQKPRKWWDTRAAPGKVSPQTTARGHVCVLMRRAIPNVSNGATLAHASPQNAFASEVCKCSAATLRQMQNRVSNGSAPFSYFTSTNYAVTTTVEK